MDVVEFAVNVLARNALEAVESGDAGSEACGQKCCLLADVISAAAAATRAGADPPGTTPEELAATMLAQDEWLAMWTDAAVPLLAHRKAPAHSKTRLSAAAVQFVLRQLPPTEAAAAAAAPEPAATARTAIASLMSSLHAEGAARKSLLEAKVSILCGTARTAPGKLPSVLPPGFVPTLLEEMLAADDEDWLGSQLHLLRSSRIETEFASAGSMWDALERRGGAAPGATASALRLSEIFGEQRLSEGFLLASLSHRTRATRRMTVELLKQRFGDAQWWGPWSAAFTVISDEQPWHLVQPAWQDAVEHGGLLQGVGGIPDVWGRALILRAASHSDNRVVRRTTQAVIAAAGEVPLETVEAVLPAALSAGTPMEGLAAAVLPLLLQAMQGGTVPSRQAAEALRDADYAALPEAQLVEAARWLGDLAASWRTSGAGEDMLAPLAIAALKVCRCYAGAAGSRRGSDSLAAVVASCCVVPSYLGDASALREAYAECDSIVEEGVAALFGTEGTAGAVGASFDAFVAAVGAGVAGGALTAVPPTSRLYYTFSKVAPAVFSSALCRLVPALQGSEGVALLELFKAASEASEATWVSGGGDAACLALEGGENVSFSLAWLAQQYAAGDARSDVLRALELFAESLSQERCSAAGWKAGLAATPVLSDATTDVLGGDAAAAERGFVLCASLPAWVWAEAGSADTLAKVLSRVTLADSGLPHLTCRLQTATAMLSSSTVSQVAEWVAGAVVPSFSATAPEDEGEKKKKKKKKQKKAGVPRGIHELMAAVEGCIGHGYGGEPAMELLRACWGVLVQHPVKFAGSRQAYAAFFRGAVQVGGPALLAQLPRLMDEVIVQSSIVAAQLTQAAVHTVDDPELLARLALTTPAPKAQALDMSHPAVVIARPHTADNPRKVDPTSLIEVVLRHVREDTADEGNDGSAVQLRRVRQWWFLCALLPQVSSGAAEAVAAAAVEGLRTARIVPRTRVLIQNAWALCCALHPTSASCLRYLIDILASPATETRLAVSAIIVAAHILLSGVQLPEALRGELVSAVIGWSMAMPHAARVHAQLVLAEYLGGGFEPAATDRFLQSARRFLDENPHVKTLRSTTGLSRLVSLYICDQPDATPEGAPQPTPLPSFVPQSVEMKVLKAMRLVQNRFTELDGDGASAASGAMPAAGWASKGSRKCPARARGSGPAEDDAGYEQDDEDVSDADSETDEEALVDPTHQRRPTPGRPPKAGQARICVVGSFLDNLPNQAGLCRTLEALFGSVAELTLPSLRATQEPAFLRMSMASERWLKLLEIPPGERLATYLQRKRQEGFRIVALEQTDNSVPAPLYTFERNTVLIIGNEQLGCPAWLLRRPELVHDFVELPLDGASRSLNAHVTASAMLWQYRMQTPA